MKTLKEYLEKILEIAEINENRDQIIQEFEEKLTFLTQLDLEATLEESKKEEYEKELNDAGEDEIKASKVIEKYFGKEKLKEIYNTNLEVFSKELTKALFTTRTPEQEKALKKLAEEFI
ncbi:hypothetical protein HN803_06735 [candidate division WWE3 bacterium]|jgi:hypothetical protein|nr:hypothetical protein [candidate division WWE3 bacterium]MBT7350451.1 hypothetical protein [candidate division WWE3 bacterium]